MAIVNIKLDLSNEDDEIMLNRITKLSELYSCLNTFDNNLRSIIKYSNLKDKELALAETIRADFLELMNENNIELD